MQEIIIVSAGNMGGAIAEGLMQTTDVKIFLFHIDEEELVKYSDHLV